MRPGRHADPALVLIGFMGAGKSRALRAARERGLHTCDVDESLEHELGMPIGMFFERHGEPEFRRREATLIANLLERPDGDGPALGGSVVALGGGALESEAVRSALAGHVVALLEVDAETAWSRVAGSGRPLAGSRERFEALLASRTPVYERHADALVPGRDDAPARALETLITLREMPPQTRLIWAASASGEYPALVGRGLLDSGWWPLDGGRFAITDATVGALYGSSLEPIAATIEVEPGEAAKTLAEAERVLRALAALGAARTDHVAALGGGVVGDLAGFCAAVYQRGIPFVGVPTTLVAQVDSAYGGKTGVDLPEAKNYVGAYHLPAAVLADPSTLETLPRAELAAGFVEVLKTALIAGGPLWERVSSIERVDPAQLDDVVFACARTKLAVVAEDERDTGRRAVLNLGHTVGHAIETATGYRRYRHGEAVGLGLLAALRLSGAAELRDELEAILARHGLPVALDHGADVDAVCEAVGRDKKRGREGVGFVLLERPGEPLTGQPVEADRLRDAVSELVAK